ncbi:unnamed protein product [Rotaria sordida]|uniref:Aminopeptidase n=1 Tax=Rotaria sordida TaxID=392033 RepID=A0A814ZVS2_9BILA|nr:unnamed protein product [Rotaria sordida]CAF3710515.1 unnamed protein product [Rotaria sordida]
MATNTKRTSPGLDESRGSGGNGHFQSLRSLPKSWIIVAVIFYCASVLTVGLLAGLLPRRTQHITIMATPTPIPPNMTTTITTTVITQDPSQCIEDECNPRLLSDLIVHSYELEYICNDIRHTTADGQVTIEFTLKQPIKQLIYHSKGMIQLEEPALFEDGIYRIVTMKQYIPNDYISLRQSTGSLFAPNRYKLVQKFVISLTGTSVGFYQNFFKDKNETMGTLLATKFRAIEARKAFPCFDEPHLKAQFKLSIIHPRNTIALSNFPNTELIVEDNLRHTKFADTFPMSTYVASWSILPDTYGKKSDDDDEPMVTVWARPEPTEKNHTALALEIASNSIPFYKDYFNTDEALPPKLDILAVFDMASVAMESSGLISFREDRIIYDEKIATTLQKQQFADIVAHEIAHSWIGNYVTCKWWDDIWFSEVTVSWLCRKTFAANYSDWNMELQILTDDTIPAMWDDAKPSSHAIVIENLTNVPEIMSYLDAITYSKGISLMRMLEKIVGPEKYRTNLQDYLLINAFDVGNLNMFYDGLLINITNGTEFMKTWLNEVNYPLLNVNLNVENGDTKLVFTQSRFIISNALNSSNLNKNYRWKINIECVLGGNYPNSDTTNIGGDRIKFILENEQENRVLPGKSYSWIKCNRNFQSFYVTEYIFPSITWQRFTSVLEAEPPFFSNEDKVNLMQDTFLLAYKGLVDYSEPLRIVRSLVQINMTQYVHWKTFQWHWETLAELVDYLPDTLTKFENFSIQQILSNGVTLDNIVALNLNENHNTKLVKSLQFALLCRMNHQSAIEKASALFKSIPIEYFNNNADINIPADFLSTVYTYHLKNDANEADWNRMYNYYKIATSTHEQTRALVAISSTNNRDRLNQLLNDGLAGRPNTIKRQDYFTMMGYMSRHPIGRETVWTFYKDNYQNLVNTFTLENGRFGAAILSVARTFGKESDLQEMNELFTKYPNAGAGESARQQAINQVKMNIEWIRSREQNLRNAFDTIS